MTNVIKFPKPRALPRFDIRWIVGRLHISVSDEEIVADFTQRCQKSPDNITPSEQKRIIEYALKTHHDNQETYRYVMSGMKKRAK